jgi:hypothetical protein
LNCRRAKMPGMDQKPPQPSRGLKRAAIALVLAAILAPPLYVLSAGPAWALRARGFVSRSAYTAVYGWALRVADRRDSSSQWVRWYLGIWGPDPYDPFA